MSLPVALTTGNQLGFVPLRQIAFSLSTPKNSESNRMRHLQPVRSVGRAELARLDEESEKRGYDQKQTDRTNGGDGEHQRPWYKDVFSSIERSAAQRP